MLKTIIATDLSGASLLAVDSVVACGGTIFGPVILLHVVDLDLYTAGGSVPGLLEFAEEQLAKEAARLRECGIDAKVRVEMGDTVEMIESAFAQEGADVVLLTNLGQGAITGRLFGSTAEKLASRGAVPVLIERVVVEGDAGVCCRTGLSPLTGRVLAAVGLDDASDHLARVAASLPGVKALRLLHVSPAEEGVADAESALEELLDAASLPFAVETAVVVGEPAETIIEDAELWGASLVVIASCAHGPAHRLVWGSVARTVAREATTSVFIVPHETV